MLCIIKWNKFTHALQRGRHLSDDSVAIDGRSSSSDDDEEEDESDTSGDDVATVTSSQKVVSTEPETIEFSTELAPGLSRQWFGHIVTMTKANTDKALVVDLDKSDMQNGSKEA